MVLVVAENESTSWHYARLLQMGFPPPRFFPSSSSPLDTGSLRQHVPGTCRTELSCSRCGVTCEKQDIFNWTTFSNDTMPVCEPVPNGCTAGSPGTTLLTLPLDRGYYRVSNTSHDVRECHRRKSCKGGRDFDDYCADGYTGPCE